MKATVSCALALLAATALSAASSSAAPRCGAVNDYPHDTSSRAKPSSFAPHEASSHHRTYGAPIQARIFKSKPKKTPQATSAPQPTSAPQLKSTPLPDS